MNSVLLGVKNTLHLVYPEETRQQLATEAGLMADVTFNKEDLEAHREELQDTRVIFSTWTMPALSDEEIARYFPKLEAVFYAAGSVQYFARPFLKRGVRVFSAWGANGVPVAEYTVAQILLANKGFFPLARMYSGGDRESRKNMGIDFPGNYGCKVGLIGAGMIGKLVIELLRRHHLQVLVYDPFLADDTAAALGVQKVDLPTLFSECQTISNHLANNKETVGMLHYDLFKLMRPGATFLNTGRGAQVVEADLCRLLREREDVTAVLDVTESEPSPEGHAFYALPNVLLTPHIAGSIGQEVERLSAYMAEEYRRFAAGEPCRWEVSEGMLATMA